jgi:hypothetical protein
MNTHDDEQFIQLCEWHSGKAVMRRRTDGNHRRWPTLLIFGACLIAIALLLAAEARAGEAKLRCTAPTTNTDGTPVNLAGINWLYGPAADKLLPLATTPGCAYTAPNLSPGTWYFAALASNQAGTQSAQSSVVSKTIAGDPPPPPPGPLQLLTAGGSVYAAIPNYTTFSWRLGAVAGTIAAGIKCDATRKIGADYYRVTSAIVWSAGKKNYVVAKCERKA